MSYIRGDYYVWADDVRLHIWARDGYDNWDDSVWNGGSRGGKADERPSGVAVPFEIADEFMVMRIAQLMEAHQLTEVVTRAIEKWKGNGGCYALTQLGDRVKRLESQPDA